MRWWPTAAPRTKPKPKRSSKSASWATEYSPSGRRNPKRLWSPKRGPTTRSSGRTEKKLLTWHSTYGEVNVLEQRLRQGRRGAQVRPFCEQAQIRARAYSLPLQRALTDFGAVHSFVEASEKVFEHYGVTLPASSVRECTLAHAGASGEVEHEAPKRPVQTLVTEMDGTMLPIVTTKTGPG